MTTPSTRTVPTTKAWIIAVFVVFTLSGLDIATWLGRIPSVRDSLGASTFEMGLLVLGMAVGSIGGLTFAGHIVAKLGARRGVQVAAACLAVGMVFAGVAVTLGWGFAAIWIALIAFGFGNGLCDVSMNVSGAAAEKAGGRTIMPLFHAAFSLGTLAGAGLGALAERFEIPVVVALHRARRRHERRHARRRREVPGRAPLRAAGVDRHQPRRDARSPAGRSGPSPRRCSSA